ncbi:hypothetical protein WAB17_03970 [Parerythrobacter aurantius]|uniref:hypothetical protein n=1 Tax=Parerythrobacter aurantius TaxID=3127706 RepID=UPI00324B9862
MNAPGISEFFTSGSAVDVVFAVLALEAAVLLARGRRPSAVLAALGPAVLMMIALRAALTGAGWPWIAVPLAAAFPVHIADLRLRRVPGAEAPATDRHLGD